MTDKHKVYLKTSMEFTKEIMGGFEVSINGNGQELLTLLAMTMAQDEGVYIIIKDAVEFFEENKGDILTMLAQGNGKTTTSGMRVDARKKKE